MGGPFSPNNFAVTIGDMGECLLPKPHKTSWCCSDNVGPVFTGSPNVYSKSIALARAGDSLTCEGGVNFIVTGVHNVIINGKLAARTNSRTLHAQGYVKGSVSSVIINGNDEGGSFGPSAMPDCASAAQTRINPGSSHQSLPNNCGTEQLRMILNLGKKAGDPGYITEQQMVDIAKQHMKDHYKENWDPKDDGLSTEQITYILSEEMKKRGKGASAIGSDSDSKGLNADQRQFRKDQGGFPTANDVQGSLINGQPVIVPLYAGGYAGDMADAQNRPAPFLNGGHVVGVVGVTYDAEGKPVSYKVVDTGNNGAGCCVDVPVGVINKNMPPAGGTYGKAVVPTK